jgi:hypothetical protein
MKSRFVMFRRAGVHYCEDTTTRKQSSLKTRDKAEALTRLPSQEVFNAIWQQRELMQEVFKTGADLTPDEQDRFSKTAESFNSTIERGVTA